ncbi:hypothetical protein [Paracoccus liaowanqingii]|uniref:hypothetical protein n=1 Tax=Paracoccus liaowanqingii TaxID=2560053 RepID=UPI00159BC07F|nr:hypothetical protein [Paracoccus liaowanqingii]
MDLPAFLGLHRRAASDEPSATSMDLRLQGREFDGAADEFLAAVDAFAALHPLARGPAALALWRMAELSPPGQVVEPAVWSARHMAAGAEGLRFVPFGRHGRRVWTGYGPPADRLATHLAALRSGAQEARSLILRIGAWSEQARAATAGIKGDNAARVIAVLAARPFCLGHGDGDARRHQPPYGRAHAEAPERARPHPRSDRQSQVQAVDRPSVIVTSPRKPTRPRNDDAPASLAPGRGPQPVPHALPGRRG